MKQVVLLGMPNTGKSTLFNRLTGAHAKVGNWPGITVELLTARLLLGNQMAQLVDLPGIYDLHGYSEDEQVVTRFLALEQPDLVIFVMNATQLDRQAHLLSQLMALGLPMMAVLNMADEARGMGISIDATALGQSLGMPVCVLSAKYGQGMEQLQGVMRQVMQSSSPRQISETGLADIEQAFRRSVDTPLQASHAITDRLDRVLLHPWLGLPIFLAVMLGLFQGVFAIGKPLQDAMAWLFTELRQQALEPLGAQLHPLLQGLLLDGLYNGLGTVASFVPLIVLFFLFMGLVEDTGYLSRAAFLMDAWMSKFGLDGRSFVMLLMGFGCNVPALMGTRVIRSRGLRLLTMLVIPFSLCSARLQVFVFLIAALFTAREAPWVLFSLYVASVLIAMATSVVFRHRYLNQEAFVLEMPPYRFPTWRQMLLRGSLEVRHFLGRSTRFIVFGVVLVWLLSNFPTGVAPGNTQSWAGLLGQWLQPILHPIGIDPQLTVALVFGFVAKEIVIGSLAVIYGQEGQALMQAVAHHQTWAQGYSFMLFALIYTPCLSTIVTLRNESKSLSFTALAVIWPLVLAWLVCYCFYQIASRWS